MTQWEYFATTISKESDYVIETRLTDAGKLGWKLVLTVGDKVIMEREWKPICCADCGRTISVFDAFPGEVDADSAANSICADCFSHDEAKS